jgi:hypothetical protein
MADGLASIAKHERDGRLVEAVEQGVLAVPLPIELASL